jgi:ketosteroid isomerase-like protein
MNTYTQDVLDLVDRWANAELTGNVDAYADLLDDEFVGVGPVGFVLDKARWAGRHRGDLENHEFEIIEPHLRIIGETAIVEAVQRQRTTAMGRDTSGSFRVVIVVVQRDGRWAIVHIQLSGPLIAAGEMPSFAR